MKAGFLRKTGAPSSDEASLTLRFYRNGDILTILAYVEDPIYLAEPWITSRSFQLSFAPVSPLIHCFPTEENTVGETAPHYPPEKNPFVDEGTVRYGVPREASIGMPEAMYPEFRKRMKSAEK